MTSFDSKECGFNAKIFIIFYLISTMLENFFLKYSRDFSIFYLILFIFSYFFISISPTFLSPTFYDFHLKFSFFLIAHKILVNNSIRVIFIFSFISCIHIFNIKINLLSYLKHLNKN